MDKGALIGIGAGAIALVALVVILIIGGGGGDSDSTTTSAESGQNGAPNTVAEEDNLTQAILSPQDGGSASGRALFGRYKKSVLLQLEAEGLEPAPAGESYTVWLYRSPKLSLRIGSVAVDEEGKAVAQLAIPAQLLGYVASAAFNQIDLSLTSNAAYKAEVTAAKAQKRLPRYTGKSILRGEITGPAIKSGNNG